MGDYLPCYCLLPAFYPALVKGYEMENSEDTKKTKQFERLYTALLLLLVALLLLISILYTSHLWLVKVAIAVILTGIGAFFGQRYLRER
jgi:uncharacterized membrane protein YdbT with pleckstrin-like domain